ncbi:type II toxin-antitoxin system RelB/DinJ family antitoxin [Klebsiella pneumoniae]|uniref:type II toxin-antitoxin system RelB/DinJ family antitoxin n=1 Tax=Klebsiella pneumoniae TaxID=573 RepID=UPI003EE0BE27
MRDLILQLSKSSIYSTKPLRIDDELKARSYAALEKMGVTPSEALRLMLEYIADNERLPFKQTLLSDEDAELVEIVKERLRKPKPVRVTLDEL